MRDIFQTNKNRLPVLAFCSLFLPIRVFSVSIPSDYQEELLVQEPVLTEYVSVSKSHQDFSLSVVSALYRGDSLFLSGNLNQALAAYSGGFRLVENAEDPWLYVLYSNRLGFTNYWLLNYNEAGIFYNQSMEVLRHADNIRDSLLLLETVVFFRMCDEMAPIPGSDNPVSMIEEYVKIKPLNLSPERETKYNLLKALWEGMEFNFYKEMNFLKNAENSNNENDQNQEFWLFIIRYYQANYYKKLKEYELAAEFAEELTGQIKTSTNLYSFTNIVTILQCDILSEKGDYKEAKYFADKLSDCLADRSHPHFYTDYLMLGWIYQHSGNKREALDYYMKSKELLDINSVEDRRMAIVYWHLAYLYRTQFSDGEKGYYYLQLARIILNKHPELYLESYIYYGLGNYHYRKKNYDEAILVYNVMLDNLERLISDDGYFAEMYPDLSRSPYLQILGRRAKSFFYSSKSRNFELAALKNSYEDYKKLFTLRKKMFEATGYEPSKIYALELLRNTINSLLNVGYTLYTKNQDDSLFEELHQFVETSKAYILKKHISDDVAKRMAGIPEELIEYSRNLKKQLDTLQYSSLSTNIRLGGSGDYLLISKILKKQYEYRNFISRLEKDYPKYADLKENSKNISLRDIQGILDESQAFIDYHYNQNSLYLFFVDKDTIQIFYQPIDRTLPDKIREYRNSFERIKFGDFDKGRLYAFANNSHEIYNLVIHPVQHLIQKKRLIIVPDRELNFIPFETLITKEIDTSSTFLSYSGLPYLLLQHPVSYLYCASQLFNSHNSPKRKVRFAGFAPDYSKFQEGENQSDSIYAQLTVLPGAHDEVFSAVEYFKGKHFEGENLGKNLFFRSMARNDIIHLAMHTILDEDEPMNSELVISSNSNEVTSQLRAYEVYSKPNSASLVVLSACNTGTGKFSGGEGVFSIARAFLLAGVYNVVFTQWRIADISSANLMDRYYNYLSNGYPTDIALQKSKIDFLTYGDPVKAHPFYWAAYVNVGKPFEFPVRKKLWYLWVLLAAGIAVAFVVIMRFRLKHP